MCEHFEKCGKHKSSKNETGYPLSSLPWLRARLCGKGWLGLTGCQRAVVVPAPEELAGSLISGVLGKTVQGQEVSCWSQSTLRRAGWMEWGEATAAVCCRRPVLEECCASQVVERLKLPGHFHPNSESLCADDFSLQVSFVARGALSGGELG